MVHSRESKNILDVSLGERRIQTQWESKVSGYHFGIIPRGRGL